MASEAATQWVVDQLRQAHEEHLKTGNYTKLGIAAQDILLAHEKALDLLTKELYGDA